MGTNKYRYFTCDLVHSRKIVHMPAFCSRQQASPSPQKDLDVTCLIMSDGILEPTHFDMDSKLLDRTANRYQGLAEGLVSRGSKFY